MARPNRNTQDAFYDVFADMSPEEQIIAMRVLEQTHRIAKRLKKPEAKPEAETPAGGQLELREPGQ